MESKSANLFRIALSFLFFLQIFLSTPVSAQGNGLPEKFEANYKLQVFGITLAHATHTLERTKSCLSMKVSTYPVGWLAFLYDGKFDIRSDIKEDDGQLLLVNHDYMHVDGSEESEASMVRYNINWLNDPEQKPAVNAKGIYKGEEISLESDKPIWDPLSIQAIMIINADKKTASYEHGLIMKGELKNYLFENQGKETIKLNGTDYSALKTVVKEAEKNRVIYVWMLPEYHNIPVKYEHWKNGELKSTLWLENVTFENNGETRTLAVTDSSEDEGVETDLYDDYE